MTSFSSKIVLTNDTSHSRMIWVEPWGGDFTLLPGKTFDIVATDANELPYFTVVEREDGTQVFVETSNPMQSDYTVTQDGERVAAGSNREQ